MKWTKKKPSKSGFYWVEFAGSMLAIHHQGPMVFDVEVENDGSIYIMEPGGDNSRSVKEYEKTDGEIKLYHWSDKPIFPPKNSLRNNS